MTAEPDIWSKWLLHGRTGGDPDMRAKVLESLRPIRDRVIEGAKLGPEACLLDVGCGDGLIGFGVLEKYPRATVIFSDISAALLEVCEQLAREAGVAERCRFVLADAQDLAPIGDCTVDAVTCRSVLIYVLDKARAHREFYRVLKPDGRLSYFEPVSSLANDGTREAAFWGYDPGPVGHLAAKVSAVFEAIQPPDDPMMNFGGRDLLGFAEDAGFERVNLSVEFEFRKGIPDRQRLTWAQWLGQSGNPKIPSVGEAIRQALTPGEQEDFETWMRPLVESGRGRFRSARAFLTAQRAQ